MIDIEVTNRCNAKCHFCPRDRTPHQGLMTPKVFDQSLRRAAEYRDALVGFAGAELDISLCGLGEPTLNRHLPDFVRQSRAAGFRVVMSSNASLLDEHRAEELLEAGLQKICINVGDEGEDYEEVYQLPFQRTLDNVVRFNEMATGRCEVLMVVVDHRSDPAHVEHMRQFWHGHGIEQVASYEVMNRGGSLFVDHMQYESYPELAEARAALRAATGTPLCGAPFGYLFVGYDGQYYLCCSDWEKQAPLGSVFDESFVGVMEAKLAHLVSREPVCRTCNLDPINRLTEELRSARSGVSTAESSAEMIESIVAHNAVVGEILQHFGTEVPAAPKTRRRIPVQSV